METKYSKIKCEYACNRLKRRFPYQWDMNIYRGCEHGCKYCYALYTGGSGETEDFYGNISVKENIAEKLERQLAAPDWNNNEIINIGGVTDSYQPAEAQFKVMPDILRLLIKYKTPAIISTKSDLPLRDFDLIDELSRITYINIAASVITTDEQLRRRLEPRSSPAAARFAMLKEFGKTNASTGLHFMPVIPFLTDGYEDIESLFAQAKDSGVDYVLPGAMYLRGKTKPAFLEFIRNEFPHLYESFAGLYKKGGAGPEYKEKLYGGTVNPLRAKYGLSSSYSKPIKEKMSKHNKVAEKQLTFPELS